MTQKPPPHPPSAPSGLSPVLQNNIAALLDRRDRQEQAKGRQDKLADTITRFTGSLAFVYLHLAVFVTWIIINLKFTPFPKFDPSFVVLAMVASVEAIFLSTFVLITQNRLAALADRRADLDLQISLLAEHEITRLVILVSAMAEKMGVADAQAPDLAELKKDVRPEDVLDRLEDAEHQRGMS